MHLTNNTGVLTRSRDRTRGRLTRCYPGTSPVLVAGCSERLSDTADPRSMHVIVIGCLACVRINSSAEILCGTRKRGQAALAAREQYDDVGPDRFERIVEDA